MCQYLPLHLKNASVSCNSKSQWCLKTTKQILKSELILINWNRLSHTSLKCCCISFNSNNLLIYLGDKQYGKTYLRLRAAYSDRQRQTGLRCQRAPLPDLRQLWK